MAIVNNGTWVSVTESDIPDGYTKPTVTEVTEGWRQNYSLTVTKSTVEDADPIIAFGNIVTEITSQVDAILANDYVATNTVTSSTEFRAIDTNQVPDVMYDTTAESFSCNVVVTTLVS